MVQFFKLLIRLFKEISVSHTVGKGYSQRHFKKFSNVARWLRHVNNKHKKSIMCSRPDYPVQDYSLGLNGTLLLLFLFCFTWEHLILKCGCFQNKRFVYVSITKASMSVTGQSFNLKTKCLAEIFKRVVMSQKFSFKRVFIGTHRWHWFCVCYGTLGIYLKTNVVIKQHSKGSYQRNPNLDTLCCCTSHRSVVSRNILLEKKIN